MQRRPFRGAFLWGFFVLAVGSSPVARAAQFSIVMLPDTQVYTESEQLQRGFEAQMRWLAKNIENKHVVFVTHVGDIVQHNTNGRDRNVAQWRRADAAFDILDAAAPNLPYSVTLGNHDVESTATPEGQPTRFHEFFGASRYAGKPWYGGASPNGNNHYQVFKGGDREYLNLNLEWRPDDASYAWAEGVLNRHADTPTIISIHQYLGRDGNRQGAGEAVFRRLIKPHPQVFMVLCGHVIGEARNIPLNAAGRPVFEILADYQGRANGGDGWLRILEFDDEAGVIGVRTFTPGIDPENLGERFEQDADSEFRLKMHWKERFGK